MIPKVISINFNKKHNTNYTAENKAYNNKYYSTNPLLADTVSFTADKKTNKETTNLEDLDIKKLILINSEAKVKKLLTQTLPQRATERKMAEITPMLAFNNQLSELKQYIEKLDNGSGFKSTTRPQIVTSMISLYNTEIFEDKKLRAKTKEVISEYLDKSEEILKSEAEKNPLQKGKTPEMSEYLTDIIWEYREEKNDNIGMLSIVASLFESEDENLSKFLNDMKEKLCSELMINRTPIKSRQPFSCYTAKVDNIISNLELGNNVFITYNQNTENSKYFIDSVQKGLQDKNYKNTKIIEFNRYALCKYFIECLDKIENDKTNNYIIIANPTSLHNNIKDWEMISEQTAVSAELKSLQDIIKAQPKNTKFIFYDDKNNFYNDNNQYKNFEEITIPVMSSAQMINAFHENPSLYRNIKTPFSKKALEKTITTSFDTDGIFPAKTLNLMQKIADYYPDKKQITEKEIDKYLKESGTVTKKDNDNKSYIMLLETGKRLKDLVGKGSTKKEVEAIVNQIKSKNMGTKGVLIYSQDGYPGGGKKFTTKAIAGEAKVPYFEINSMDFGTEKVDLFGDTTLSPENSMKKLFSAIYAQAEENPYKSAVLYIEDFEYLSFGEMISPYYQKAMAQLKREMDKANDAGLNILIVGSVQDPDIVSATAMKSFKFIDKIEVSSTAYDRDARIEVISDCLKKMKIKFSGNKDEQKELISYIADITQYASFIEIKNLFEKIQTVAKERNHKNIEKADITEAYLQLACGRPSTIGRRPHEARITATHECGHALSLEVMNNIAKTKGKEWHIPDKVNFITLDPRGYFGAAVFDGRDKNSEKTFENMFADIVYTLGSTSVENRFYGIDGSWGITQDMISARENAMIMVRNLGMGAKIGKMRIFQQEDLSDKTKEMIENDERVILHNAKITADLIAEIYEDFINQFTEKYYNRVGTGECIIFGDDFRKELNDWKKSQSPEKQKELELCDDTIIQIMEATKKGIEVRKES